MNFSDFLYIAFKRPYLNLSNFEHWEIFLKSSVFLHRRNTLYTRFGQGLHGIHSSGYILGEFSIEKFFIEAKIKQN